VSPTTNWSKSTWPSPDGERTVRQQDIEGKHRMLAEATIVLYPGIPFSLDGVAIEEAAAAVRDGFRGDRLMLKLRRVRLVNRHCFSDSVVPSGSFSAFCLGPRFCLQLQQKKTEASLDLLSENGASECRGAQPHDSGHEPGVGSAYQQDGFLRRGHDGSELSAHSGPPLEAAPSGSFPK
jgi:hypothetical protein